jgi:enoyl-CoA hydratase/carnithine racemase
MDISTNKTGGILTIAFNRPEKKNAITAAMYQAIAQALTEAESDSAVKVIIIAGKQGVFTAGNDLEDFLKNPPTDADSPVVQFMQALSQASKPVLAAVSGNAVGIGTTLLMHCDLVYAAENARFAMPFTPLGLCPEFGSSMLLPRIAGYQRAAEKLLFGEPFGAQEAREMGLVNKVLPPAELEDHVQAQAEKLAALPTRSLRITKRLMKAHDANAVAVRMEEEIRHFSEMLDAPEAREAFQAFLEKRKPDFSRLA